MAELIMVGWTRATSIRPLIEHRIGEPVLMTRDLKFVLVMPDGTEVIPTVDQIAEW